MTSKKQKQIIRKMCKQRMGNEIGYFENEAISELYIEN